MIKKTFKSLTYVICSLLFSISANAHVWQIGWEANIDGSLDFFGVSYHTGSLGTFDDFSLNPAGLVINGTNVSFDLGSAIDLNDCLGLGVIVGSCSPGWNALGLDGSITANGYASSRYGKYASVNLSSAELATLGISAGNNSVTVSTYANNVHWAGLTFNSATVPIDIRVLPVPEPSTLAILALGLLGLNLRKKS